MAGGRHAVEEFVASGEDTGSGRSPSGRRLSRRARGRHPPRRRQPRSARRAGRRGRPPSRAGRRSSLRGSSARLPWLSSAALARDAEALGDLRGRQDGRVDADKAPRFGFGAQRRAVEHVAGEVERWLRHRVAADAELLDAACEIDHRQPRARQARSALAVPILRFRRVRGWSISNCTSAVVAMVEPWIGPRRSSMTTPRPAPVSASASMAPLTPMPTTTTSALTSRVSLRTADHRRTRPAAASQSRARPVLRRLELGGPVRSSRPSRTARGAPAPR